MRDFDITYNKHHGNPQSNEAYEANKRVKNKQRQVIIDYIQRCGTVGATADEISQALFLPLHTTSARCSELKRDGVVVKTGTRRTHLGCSAGVLVINSPISVDTTPNYEPVKVKDVCIIEVHPFIKSGS